MRTLTRSIAFATLLAFGAACSDDSNAPNSEHVGTYTLQSVLGDPVPSLLDSGPDYTFEVISETLTLNSNGTWAQAGLYRVNDAGSVVDIPLSCRGTYQRNGSNLTLSGVVRANCDAGPFAATFTGGNTITVEPGDFDAIYRK